VEVLVVLVMLLELLVTTLFYSLQVQAHTQEILLQLAVVMVADKLLAVVVEVAVVVALLVGITLLKALAHQVKAMLAVYLQVAQTQQAVEAVQGL
jgi:hypothetical protein